MANLDLPAGPAVGEVVPAAGGATGAGYVFEPEAEEDNDAVVACGVDGCAVGELVVTEDGVAGFAEQLHGVA